MDFKIVDGVEIPFDEQWSSIAVSVSGGADSALLAHLLCEFVTETGRDIPIHFISHIRCWKTKPWQQWDSFRVYSHLADKFKHISMRRHQGFVAPDLEWGENGPNMVDEYGKTVSGDNIQSRAYSEYLCHKLDIPVYFNAVTKNPKDVDFKGLDPRDVEPTEDNRHLTVMEHMGRLACHPFRFVQKDWVVKQYRDKRLLDLFDKTRSCEGTFEHIDYTNYHIGTLVPTCGKCFWCRERDWAIEKTK